MNTRSNDGESGTTPTYAISNSTVYSRPTKKRNRSERGLEGIEENAVPKPSKQRRSGEEGEQKANKRSRDHAKMARERQKIDLINLKVLLININWL